MSAQTKLKVYYFTAILSLVFAVVGFSYNAWRMEVSEDNNNIRTASFEVLRELAELERVIFAAHYDKDPVEGNPRKGWIKVGLINDLSSLIGEDVQLKATELKQMWAAGWERVELEREIVENLATSIDSVRAEIKAVLAGLD